MADDIMEFCPDGSVRCLYHEAINLHALGRLTVRRASKIEFDERRQMWAVTVGRSRKPVFFSTSRQECLQWERQHFASRP
ncbi:MAG: hypothetical protein BWZ02_02865 [Lentisphaerae bacterium ADurb.BinA184]|nr:MAG: hypothetical protein BWZ02_02865 [Lentisphaerae bacterium ADurb.BinA184]